MSGAAALLAEGGADAHVDPTSHLRQYQVIFMPKPDPDESKVDGEQNSEKRGAKPRKLDKYRLIVGVQSGATMRNGRRVGMVTMFSTRVIGFFKAVLASRGVVVVDEPLTSKCIPGIRVCMWIHAHMLSHIVIHYRTHSFLVHCIWSIHSYIRFTFV